MKLKRGTLWDGIDPVMLLAVVAADGVWRDLGVRDGVTVTCGRDGVHTPGSLHYPKNSPSGMFRAVDLRIRDLPAVRTYAQMAARMLKERLSQDFQVILEDTHIHVEFDPR